VHTSTRLRRWMATSAATLALILGSAIGAAPAHALAAGPYSAPALAPNPYERGPAPTNASLEAARGPFAVAQVTVPAQTTFGGGVIYYPTDTSQGTFGAVAISPGFTARWSSLSWLGPRIASHGFVVIGIETLSTLDQPAARGRQLLAALDYLTGTSSVRTRIDASRLAVSGHSMGGGGSLEAARTRPTLQAAVPLAPWHTTKNWSTVQVPTAIIGGEADTTAPPDSHAIPFYNSIPAATEKSYLELNNAGHTFPNTVNTPTAKQTVSWLKRFVDNDTRYDQFLCPGPSGSAIEEYRSTCPLV
jgi:predicted dienelactone hydrolase